MNYCSKCGKELQQDVKFCQHCGEKVEVNKTNEENISNNQDDNVKTNSTINETNSQLSQANLKEDKRKKILIARYCIGGFLILTGMLNIVSFGGILSILIGLSLMPFVYKILKEKKNIYFKGIEIVVPVLLIFFFGMVNSISSNDLSSENESGNNGETNITETTENETNDNSETQVSETAEEKWLNYYKEKNIEVIDVDSDILYTYGEYYVDYTILTTISIKDISGKSVKANVENNDSIFYSFVFNFEDKNELKKYKEDDMVTIIGKVSSKSSKTVTLEECHIIKSGKEAENKKNELLTNKETHKNFAENIKSKKEEEKRNQELAKKNEYKNQCKDVDYQSILRNPANFENEYIKTSGKVIQVSNGFFNGVTLRVNDSNDNTWYINYTYKNDAETKILENDRITIYGKSTGVTSYTTIVGSQVTIPSIKAEYIDIG